MEFRRPRSGYHHAESAEAFRVRAFRVRRTFVAVVEIGPHFGCLFRSTLLTQSDIDSRSPEICAGSRAGPFSSQAAIERCVAIVMRLLKDCCIERGSANYWVRESCGDGGGGVCVIQSILVLNDGCLLFRNDYLVLQRLYATQRKKGVRPGSCKLC